MRSASQGRWELPSQALAPLQQQMRHLQMSRQKRPAQPGVQQRGRQQTSQLRLRAPRKQQQQRQKQQRRRPTPLAWTASSPSPSRAPCLSCCTWAGPPCCLLNASTAGLQLQQQSQEQQRRRQTPSGLYGLVPEPQLCALLVLLTLHPRLE